MSSLMTSARDRFASLLGGAATAGSFSARRTARPDDLRRVIYKPCGNRRTSVCPACAETYRRDAFEVIRTGLVGGKGVPVTAARHPAVFPTLTAPGFGIVHRKTGRAIPCRPRRIIAQCLVAT